MSDRIFLDSNIMVYAHTDLDTVKQSIAQGLIAGTDSIISTQVLQELANTLSKKFKIEWNEIIDVLTDTVTKNILHVNNRITVNKACQIANRYRFSFYDSMIVSAATESNCNVLYSEDMSVGQVIDGKLTIKNSFKI